jgi:hypothetical protein
MRHRAYGACGSCVRLLCAIVSQRGCAHGRAMSTSARCDGTSRANVAARCAHVLCQLPRRVRCPRRRAMPVQRARAPEQAQEDTSPKKNKCDKQVPVETYQLSH